MLNTKRRLSRQRSRLRNGAQNWRSICPITSQDYYRSHSPEEAWQDLRDDPNMAATPTSSPGMRLPSSGSPTPPPMRWLKPRNSTPKIVLPATESRGVGMASLAANRLRFRAKRVGWFQGMRLSFPAISPIPTTCCPPVRRRYKGKSCGAAWAPGCRCGVSFSQGNRPGLWSVISTHFNSRRYDK